LAHFAVVKTTKAGGLVQEDNGKAHQEGTRDDRHMLTFGCEGDCKTPLQRFCGIIVHLWLLLRLGLRLVRNAS
jgi:hypothetical protein